MTDAMAEMYVLANGVTVPAAFYNRILNHLQERVPQLPPGASFTLKQICGPKFWDPLSDGDRRLAGQCATDMVERGLVPLVTAPSRHEYPKRYQRR